MAFSGNTEIVLVYIIGTFGMIILAGAVFFFFVTYQKRLLKKELEIHRIKTEQQEELLKNTVLAQEQERKRIAQDLHDEVGAMLSVVKLNVSRFEKKSEAPDMKKLAFETRNYLNDVIGEVRRISRALMPPLLEKLGLYFAVEELVGRINKSNQLYAVCWKSGEPFRINTKDELAVFRVVQELINNAIKHSQASQIMVKIRFGTASFALSVSDNGVGFDMEKVEGQGLGLKNLESRTQMAKARFKMKSAPGKGTSSILFLNVKPN